MTTTEERTEVRASSEKCPAWCAGSCEQGAGHLGWDIDLKLALMAPDTGEDYLHKVEYFEPAVLKVCLAQRHGASLPTILVTSPHTEDPITLTIAETLELVETLKTLMTDGKGSVDAAAEVPA